MNIAAVKTENDKIHLTAIKLHNFRNYETLSLSLDPRHVILTGQNGSGKTNLLEAISFLSPGRGLRRAAYDSISRQKSGGDWSVFCQLEGAQGEVAIGTGIGTGISQQDGVSLSQRQLRINGTPAKTSDELLDHARILWLTPAMDGLFNGPAGERRRFIDRLVLAVDPHHGRRVSDFEKAMRNRNRLLSEEADGASHSAWLDAIETQMAELGTAIAAARKELVALLGAMAVKQHDPTSAFPDAILHMDGILEEGSDDLPASDLEAEYAARLRNARGLDRAARRTLEGPHRSDLEVMHRPKMMAAKNCSTGEQKALLVGILLAHAQLVAQMNNFAPILLLDEIAAHLDEHRRAALFDRIDGLNCQAFMTGTDKALFEALGKRGQFFTARDGIIDREA